MATMKIVALTKAAEAAVEANLDKFGFDRVVAEKALAQLGGQGFVKEVKDACRDLRDGDHFVLGAEVGLYTTDFTVIRDVVYAHVRHAGTCSYDSPCRSSAPRDEAYNLIPDLQRLMFYARKERRK